MTGAHVLAYATLGCLIVSAAGWVALARMGRQAAGGSVPT